MGGLGRAIKANANVGDAEYITDPSDPDSNSDGARIPRPARTPRRRCAAASIASEEAVEEPNPTEDVGGLEVPVEVVPNAVEAMDEVVEVLVEAADEVGALPSGGEDQTTDVAAFQRELQEKDWIINSLRATIKNLKLEVSTKNNTILELRSELRERQPSQHVQAPSVVAAEVDMEVDEEYINNVVDIATAGVLEDIRSPVKRQRPPVFLPPMGPLARPYVDIDGPLSQDSLSFDSFATSTVRLEIEELRKANDELRLRVS